MSCGCGCSGELMGSCGSGLNGLMGALSSGSRVRVGFPFQLVMVGDVDELETHLVSYIQDGLYNALADDVTFTNVNVAVNPPGYFSDGYITVSATTKTSLPSANVFGDMVEYAIHQYLPRIYTTRRDETLIDYVAPGNVGKPGVQQAGPPKVCDWNTMDFRDYVDCTLGIGRFGQQTTQTTQQQRQQLPPAPGECQWSSMPFGEWVACQLGIKSAIGGVAAGATGALVGVGVLTLLAVVLLKR